MNQALLEQRIRQARGQVPADLVIKQVQYLSIFTGELLKGDIAVCGDTIVGVGESYRGKTEIDGRGLTAVPGFIDAHLHIESGMLLPYEFEREVLPLGTTTAICDPHEMSNVCGSEAIRYFQKCAEGMLLDLRVQLSSCVPASPMETSGARLEAGDLLPLRGHPSNSGLAEMMNYPGVVECVPEVLEKLAAFAGGNLDGHAPLLGGRDLNAYLSAGVNNDHECTSPEEAREKLRKGMRIFIREGSASRDLSRLLPIIAPETAPYLAFCTDDRSPLEIAAEGHIDHLIRTAIKGGVPPALAYRIASRSAAEAFGLLDRGLIAPGCRADLVLLEDYRECRVARVLKNGETVTPLLLALRPPPPSVDFARHSVRCKAITPEMLAVHAANEATDVIGIDSDTPVTLNLVCSLPIRNGVKQPLPEKDILKVVVFERHGVNGNIAHAFIEGFNLKSGAMASSVGHDSHNLCAVGVNDEDIALALNTLIACGGGQCVTDGGQVAALLELPIAGLLSELPHEELEEQLLKLRHEVRGRGCQLEDPFQQLSFLTLSVIPHLKLTDRGLVDVDNFQLIPE